MNDRPVCMVTGATRGIGRAIAEGLAAHARVILACRDEVRGREVARAIAGGSDRAEVLVVDLARPASIHAAMAEVVERFPRIDVLVNNAGVWSTAREVTADGIERTWATNVLGYFLVSHLLGPHLSQRARVVNVASGLAHSLDLADVEFTRRRYRGVDAYAQSKQCNRMLTRAFARRWMQRGITVNAMHPGFTRTDAFGAGGGWQGRVAGVGALIFGKPPRRAADTAIWLATSRDVDGITGAYFQDRREVPCPYADVDKEDALHDLCAHMTGVDPARRDLNGAGVQPCAS
jgi:NAD(P)-dependent dehydrogenase (short-subunit alcohol dehydrogenase family)